MRRRLLTYTGVAGGGVSLAAVLLATLLAPWFTWTGNALSDLGAADAATAPLFNGGLIVGGLVGLAFAVPLWRAAERPTATLAAVTYAGALAAMALVGLFPTGTSLHVPVALTFFGLLTLTLWLSGVAAVGRGEVTAGGLVAAAGLVHVGGWLVWAAGFLPPDGIAIPEIVGSFALLGWAVWRTRALLSGGPSPL